MISNNMRRPCCNRHKREFEPGMQYFFSADRIDDNLLAHPSLHVTGFLLNPQILEKNTLKG